MASWLGGLARFEHHWLWDLNEEMIGTEKDCMLGSKGQETRSLVPFVVELLTDEAVREKLPSGRGDCLLRAAQELAIMLRVLCSSETRKMEVEQICEFRGAYARHLKLFKSAGGVYLPKHHFFFHEPDRMAAQGNPRTHTTYWDEALNGILADVARSAHRLTFCRTVFEKYGARHLNFDIPDPDN